MTDNEIIKALECCICSTSRNDCENLNCPACQEIGCCFMNRSTEYYPESLIQEIGKSVLDLINLQKAEIERLKHRKTELQIRNQELQHEKSEAIKEFAKRLKDNYCFTDRWGKIIPISTVNTLVKEMAGDTK